MRETPLLIDCTCLFDALSVGFFFVEFNGTAGKKWRNLFILISSSTSNYFLFLQSIRF